MFIRRRRKGARLRSGGVSVVRDACSPADQALAPHAGVHGIPATVRLAARPEAATKRRRQPVQMSGTPQRVTHRAPAFGGVRLDTHSTPHGQ